jgi:hypothetical protein
MASKDSRYRQPDYECKFCPGLIFRGYDWHRRNNHLRVEHRMRITWGCPVCTYRQSSRRFSDLLNHIRVKHGRDYGQPVPHLEPLDEDSLSPSPARRQSPRKKPSKEAWERQERVSRRQSPRVARRRSPSPRPSHRRSPTPESTVPARQRSPSPGPSHRRSLTPEFTASACRHSPSPGPSRQCSPSSESTSPAARGEVHLSASPQTPPSSSSRRKNLTPRKIVKSTVTSVTVSTSKSSRQERAAAVTTQRTPPRPVTPCRSHSPSSPSPTRAGRSLSVVDVERFLRTASSETRQQIRRSLTPKSKSRGTQVERHPTVVHTQEDGLHIDALGVHIQVEGPIEEIHPPTP